MKILHFLWALDNGGAENLVVDLANEQSRDNEVILLIANKRVDAAVRKRLAPEVQFVCLGRPAASRNPYWVARLLFALKKLHPDVVHAHSDQLAKLDKFITAPLVLTVHDTHIELNAAVRNFSLVCCISETVLRDVCSRYPTLKVRQVNNGIRTADIATGGYRAPGSPRGIQVSRLVHEKKGQDLLIKALALVNATPNQRKLSIDFVGDGPSLKHLIAIADDAGVSEFCHFVGPLPRDQVYQDLCKYDLLIQPSRYEGFGLTVAEAMAAGIAVVVSDIEGPMEIIDGGKFGFFFRANDVDSLAASLGQAMSSFNTLDGDALRSAARKHALEKYDLLQTSSNYCQIYREIIDA